MSQFISQFIGSEKITFYHSHQKGLAGLYCIFSGSCLFKTCRDVFQPTALEMLGWFEVVFKDIIKLLVVSINRLLMINTRSTPHYSINFRFIAGCCWHLPLSFTSNSVTLKTTQAKKSLMKTAEQNSGIVLKLSPDWITLNWKLNHLMTALTSLRNALKQKLTRIHSMTGKWCSKPYQCLQESWVSMICHLMRAPFMSSLLSYSPFWFSLSSWT